MEITESLSAELALRKVRRILRCHEGESIAQVATDLMDALAEVSEAMADLRKHNDDPSSDADEPFRCLARIRHVVDRIAR